MGKLREIQSRILVYTMIIDMDDDNLGYEMDAFFVSAEVNTVVIHVIILKKKLITLVRLGNLIPLNNK